MDDPSTESGLYPLAERTPLILRLMYREYRLPLPRLHFIISGAVFHRDSISVENSKENPNLNYSNLELVNFHAMQRRWVFSIEASGTKFIR